MRFRWPDEQRGAPMQLLEAILPAMMSDRTATSEAASALGFGDFLAVMQAGQTQVADAAEISRPLVDSPVRTAEDATEVTGAEVLYLESHTATLVPQVLKLPAAEIVATPTDLVFALPVTNHTQETGSDDHPETDPEGTVVAATPQFPPGLPFWADPPVDLVDNAVARDTQAATSTAMLGGTPILAAHGESSVAGADAFSAQSAMEVTVEPPDEKSGPRSYPVPVREAELVDRHVNTPPTIQPIPPAPGGLVSSGGPSLMQEFRPSSKQTSGKGRETEAAAIDPAPTRMADGRNEPNVSHPVRPMVKPIQETESPLPHDAQPAKSDNVTNIPLHPAASGGGLTGAAIMPTEDLSRQTLMPAAGVHVAEAVAPHSKKAAPSPQQISAAGGDILVPVGQPTQAHSHTGPKESSPHDGQPQLGWAQSAGRQLAVAMGSTDGHPVEVTLSPDELGKVRMTFAVADGALTLTLVADRPQTLDLMRRNIDQLAQEFRDLGYQNLNFSFAQNRDQRRNQSRGEDRAGTVETAPYWPPPEVAPAAASRDSRGVDLRL